MSDVTGGYSTDELDHDVEPCAAELTLSADGHVVALWSCDRYPGHRGPHETTAIEAGPDGFDVEAVAVSWPQ